MGKDLKYAILVDLKGNAAKAIRDLGGELDKLGKRGPAFGGFAQMFGGGVGGRITEALATRPGGVGGMLSDVIKGATSLALVPVRILSSFAGLIPAIGGIFSSIVGTAANILQGLIGIVANIVGGILNAFGALVGKVAEIMGKVVGTVAKIGLGVGAAIGVALAKGVAENLQEMQLKAILSRRLGAGFTAAWAEIEKQFAKTAFSQEELAGALTVLARADLKAPERLLRDIADAAVGARMPLEQVADLFLKLATAGGPEGEVNMGRLKFALREMGFDAATIEKIRTVDQLAGALRAKFGGLAQEVARLSPMKKLWQEIGETLETLTEPLTRAIIPAFARLNDWLDHLRDSPAIKKLADEIGRLATDAIGGLERALDWLSTREFKWSNIVAGFKQGWTDVLPTLWETLKAGFDLVIAYAKGLFTKLWVEIGQDLANELGRVMVGIGGKVQVGAARQAGMFTGMQRWGGLGVPGGGHEGFFGGFADIGAVLLGTAGKAILGEKMGPTAVAEFKVGQGIAALGEKMFGAARTDAEKVAILKSIDQNMANAAAALNAAAGRLGGAAGGAAGVAFPMAMPERVGMPIPALPPDAQVAATRAAIAMRNATADALERSGYVAQAKAMREQTAAMSATLTDILNRMVDDLIQHTGQIAALDKELVNLRQRVKNLGTAR